MKESETKGRPARHPILIQKCMRGSASELVAQELCSRNYQSSETIQWAKEEGRGSAFAETCLTRRFNLDLFKNTPV
jgi:hypothetical protein